VTSPTQRSLKLLRDRGMFAYVVEKWVPQARKRIDVAGFGDLLAWSPVSGCVLIQTTTGSHVAARTRKILEDCREPALAWIASGGRIVVHGWRKIRRKWECREVWITGPDFDEEDNDEQ